MKRHLFVLYCGILLCGCSKKRTSHNYTTVTARTVFEDSVSIRAIDFLDRNTLAFAGSNSIYGSVDLPSHKVRVNQIKFDTLIPEFRSVAHTSTDFFMLSVDTPALLYKTGANGQMNLVYKEEGEGAFYDSMQFWNDLEGIAVGDTVNGCLSVLTTRDGGQTWSKLSCDALPEPIEGEGAFAASNTNIAIVDDKTWVATTKRVLFSPDKGFTWQAFDTPIMNEQPTQGMYSIDFYNAELGFAVGGDYTNPTGNQANKALTTDGGKTWNVIANGTPPGYKSCVQFIPNSGGEDLVAIGFTGISYSDNGGHLWKDLSKEGFYTIRFLNDSIAYAAGKNRIAKLTFR
jgi:photosystem II stability/assembly factor-like uncharacterized protein